MRIKNLFLPVAVVVIISLFGCGSPGKEVPNLSLDALEQGGKRLKLHDLKGKVVMLDFWATWCGPCRESMPLIQKLHEKYKDKGLEVIAVSNEERAPVQRFIKQNKYTYAFYMDLMSILHQEFNITGIPTTIILDKDSRKVYEGHPLMIEELEKVVVEHLEK